ncbi:hypothetical protein Bca52824_033045 [Brassica carinata]|uniref:Uncharacterized protein n=1 Tax=Brassica carinata TaxID=52824 RepID=A0A8X7V6R2_BRACI|nr:hypothetical protein Bca52824_033045 [Brassica carinata]
MNPSLYPTEWWEYVMEYSKEITSLLNNSMFSPAPLIEDPISVTKVVFKTGEYKQQVIFIGGLTDGILATEYEASLFSLMSYLLSSPELLPPPLVTTTTVGKIVLFSRVEDSSLVEVGEEGAAHQSIPIGEEPENEEMVPRRTRVLEDSDSEMEDKEYSPDDPAI